MTRAPQPRPRRNTFRSGAYLLAGQGIVYIANFASTIVLSRRLGTAVFGLFITLLTLRDTAAALTSLMVNLAILKNRENAIEVARVSIGVIAMLSVGFLAAECILFVTAYDLSVQVLGALALLSFAHIVMQLYGPYSAMLQLRDAYKNLAWINTTATVAASVIAIVASFFMKDLMPLILREVIFAVIVVGLLLRTYGAWIRPSLSRTLASGIFRFSAGLWGSRTAELWIDRRDKFNVGMLTSVEGMALYNHGKYLAEITQLLLNPLSVLLFDRYSDPSVPLEKKQTATDAMVLALLLIGIVSVVVIWFAGGAIVRLLYGEEWSGAAAILSAFAGYSMLYPIYIITKNIGYAENKVVLVVITQAVYLLAILAVPAVSTSRTVLLSPYVHFAGAATGILAIALVSRTMRTSTAVLALAAGLLVLLAGESGNTMYFVLVVVAVTSATALSLFRQVSVLRAGVL